MMNNTLWTDTPIVPDDGRKLTSHDERNLWEQSAYPIGNGRLGCTVFGDLRKERVQFNQDSLWVGNEDNTGAYQPFGDVYVELDAACGMREAEERAGSGERGARNTDGGGRRLADGGRTSDVAGDGDYRRELDIERAVQTISYASGGVNYKREYFASYPAQVIVMHFTADRPGAYSGRIFLGNSHDIPTTVEEDALVMRGDTGCLWYWRRILAEPKRLIADRDYASPRNIDLDFEARVRLIHKGGTCGAAGKTLVFKDCDSVTLFLAADTSYLADRERGWHGEHPGEKVAGLIAAASTRAFADLLEEHVADYQGVFHRLTLDLGPMPEKMANLPTAARLKAYQERVAGGQKPLDPALEALLYQYARYLMICSSRPGHGALPANLQGIWLISKNPSWRCDFHTDINLQMNYWFADAANLADCFEPFAKWIDSIRDVRKEETRRVLGVERGWLTRSENGLFGGATWHIQKGDSAWLCQNLWDHYTFTMDRDYLERYAYPVMKEISQFWLDHLKELPDGTLVAPTGRSPEHGPVGVDGVTYDQVLCWDLFSNTITAAETLGLDADFYDELVEKRDRLLAPQVGRWGQLQEWMEDIDDPEDDHRHINHLICVYPGRQVTPGETPELAEAARTSLVARRDHGQGHPAWSRVWKACIFARLLDGKAAHGELIKTLGTHIYKNLWAVHPPFQIDANFGYAAAVNEMLVQSHLQEQGAGGARAAALVHLLPALPAAWPEGSVTGLRARGGCFVDIDWTAGRLTRATLHNPADTPKEITVRYGKVTKLVALSPGASHVVAFGPG